jgi:hypothetical protein
MREKRLLASAHVTSGFRREVGENYHMLSSGLFPCVCSLNAITGESGEPIATPAFCSYGLFYEKTTGVSMGSPLSPVMP